MAEQSVALDSWDGWLNEQNKVKFGNYLEHGPAEGLFLDIGAENGTWTLAALAAGFEKAIAVEKDSERIEAFRDRLREMNILDTHGVFPWLTDCLVIPGYHRPTNNEIGFNTLITFAANYSDKEKIQFLKMDIEGDEYAVLTDSPDDVWMDSVSYMNLESHGKNPTYRIPKSGIDTHEGIEEWLTDKGWTHLREGNWRNDR